MQEVIEKIIKKLEKEKEQSYYEATSKGRRANGKNIAYGENLAYQKAIDIVKKEATTRAISSEGRVRIMRTIPEVCEDIKSILTNIERTENCDGETLVDIDELVNEILIISTYKHMKQTNADRIRSMSDEDLEMNMMCPNENGLGEIDYDKSDNCNCYECILHWLQSEVEE